MTDFEVCPVGTMAELAAKDKRLAEAVEAMDGLDCYWCRGSGDFLNTGKDCTYCADVRKFLAAARATDSASVSPGESK